MTKLTLPSAIRSTAVRSAPSLTLPTIEVDRLVEARRGTRQCRSSRRCRGRARAAAWRRRDPAGLSPSASDRNTVPSVGSSVPAASSALKNALPNVMSMPITSPVRAHLRPERGVDLGEAAERQHRLLDRDVTVRRRLAQQPSLRSSASVAPSITRVATLASGTPVALATNGTVRLARGLASITCTVVPVHRVLHVDQAAHVQRRGDRAGVRLDHLDHPRGQRLRRDRARGVAAVHARFLDVLHDAADQHLAGRVADRVDVDLDRVLEEAVDQHRTLGGQATLLAERSRRRSARPSPARGGRRRGRSACRARRARSSGGRAPGTRRRRRSDAPDRASAAVPPGGCGMHSFSHSAFHFSRSSARSIDAGDVPAISSTGSSRASFSGVCPPSDTISFGATPPAAAVSAAITLRDVLERQRLEVEAVARVVVGADRLRVAVDHHRLEAGVAQRERGVHAAVVELDALADPVRPAAEDDDRRLGRRADLVLVLPRRVVVRRLGGELGRARVDRLERRHHPGRLTARADLAPPARSTGGRAARRRTRAA